MKIVIFFIGVFFVCYTFANNVIVDGTRFIYPDEQNEITIGMFNTANRPAIVQSWLDNGDPNEAPHMINTPFHISPPIARIEANKGQILRVILTDKTGLPKNKESIWWLNILDIPSISREERENTNFLQLAIRSRFKFIYRPAEIGMPPATNQHLLLKAKRHQLFLKNTSPFYTTVTKISTNGKDLLNAKSVMVAPFSCVATQLKKEIKTGIHLIVDTLNDYGADVTSTLLVK